MKATGSGYCPGCGTERLTGATFCQGCGQRLPGAPGASSVEGDDRADAGGPQRRPRLALALGVVALVGALGFGVMQAQAAGTTRATLDATSATLDQATTDLAATQDQLADAQAAEKTANNRADVLSRQLEGRTECVSALVANAIELDRIRNEWVANFARDTEDSTAGKADAKRDKYLDAAIADYYKAYSAAFDGRRTTANSWIAKGNTAIKKAAAQVKIVNAEIKAINAKTVELEAASVALDTSIAATTTTCQATGF